MRRQVEVVARETMERTIAECSEEHARLDDGPAVGISARLPLLRVTGSAGADGPETPAAWEATHDP